MYNLLLCLVKYTEYCKKLISLIKSIYPNNEDTNKL